MTASLPLRTAPRPDVAGGSTKDAAAARPTRLDAALRTLECPSELRAISAGAILFRQGDPVREMFLVQSGSLSLVRHTVEGVRLTLQQAGPGEMLAEASLFAERYHCEAVAGRPARVRVFGRRALLDAVDRDPGLARSLMAQLAGQVVALRTRLELRNVRSARERVRQHLSLAADQDRSVSTPGPLTEMAETLGLTPEALYRTLAALERDGEIVRHRDMIRIMPGLARDRP